MVEPAFTTLLARSDRIEGLVDLMGNMGPFKVMRLGHISHQFDKNIVLLPVGTAEDFGGEELCDDIFERQK